MVDLREVVSTLISIGFYDILLPFILVYAVVYGILIKSGIFEGGSSDRKLAINISSIVAFVFGLIVVTSLQIVTYIQNLIVNVVLIVVFILCLFIVLGFILGDRMNQLFENSKVKYGVAVLSFIVVLSVLFSILGTWTLIGNWWSDFIAQNATLLTSTGAIVGLGLILYWITASGSKESNSGSSEK